MSTTPSTPVTPLDWVRRGEDLLRPLVTDPTVDPLKPGNFLSFPSADRQSVIKGLQRICDAVLLRIQALHPYLHAALTFHREIESKIYRMTIPELQERLIYQYASEIARDEAAALAEIRQVVQLFILLTLQHSQLEYAETQTNVHPHLRALLEEPLNLSQKFDKTHA